jgi:hypothetical protein
MVDLVGLGRRREHDGVARLPEVGDELARALERLHLGDQRHVERLLGGADVVAVLLVELLAHERGDELVAAHADVAVDPPDRKDDAVLAERPVPGDRVLVVGVDERAVDVEDRGGPLGPVAG